MQVHLWADRAPPVGRPALEGAVSGSCGLCSGPNRPKAAYRARRPGARGSVTAALANPRDQIRTPPLRSSAFGFRPRGRGRVTEARRPAPPRCSAGRPIRRVDRCAAQRGSCSPRPEVGSLVVLRVLPDRMPNTARLRPGPMVRSTSPATRKAGRSSGQRPTRPEPGRRTVRETKAGEAGPRSARARASPTRPRRVPRPCTPRGIGPRRAWVDPSGLGKSVLAKG